MVMFLRCFLFPHDQRALEKLPRFFQSRLLTRNAILYWHVTNLFRGRQSVVSPQIPPSGPSHENLDIAASVLQVSIGVVDPKAKRFNHPVRFLWTIAIERAFQNKQNRIVLLHHSKKRPHKLNYIFQCRQPIVLEVVACRQDLSELQVPFSHMAGNELHELRHVALDHGGKAPDLLFSAALRLSSRPPKHNTVIVPVFHHHICNQCGRKRVMIDVRVPLPPAQSRNIRHIKP